MVICLQQGADLHISHLMPLPLTVSCFSKIQIDSFLVPAHPGSPRIRAVKMSVCVCISIHKIPIYDTAVPMVRSSASKLYYTSWSSVSLPQTYVIMLIAHEWISTSLSGILGGESLQWQQQKESVLSTPPNCRQCCGGPDPRPWLDDLHTALFCLLHKQCLQCFDAVGWVAGRASSL